MSSFGEDIRRERELRRITLREVAESTKITLRYLEALEKNDFDQLPGGVFNRGFVRAYAEFIGVDPESMVTAYLLELQTGSSPDGESNKNAAGTLLRGNRARGTVPVGVATSDNGLPTWSKWLLALMAVVILVLGGLYFFERMSKVEPRPATASPASTAHPGATPAAPTNTPVAHTDTGVAPERVLLEEPGTPVPDRVTAVIHVDRATSGRVNCDNRQIETLDGARGGTRLRLEYSRFLIFDAADAGALRLTLADGAAHSLGKDGESLVGYRVDVSEPDPVEIEQ